jgi:hypothetical protein
MSRAESAKKLQEILNDELCTLVACRQAMERVKEPATVAELRRIASRHEDSISHLRVAIIDRAEEPEDDPAVKGPWLAAAKELGAATQSEMILNAFRKTEALCRDRVARAAATVGTLDETARRMVSEVILPRHNESLEMLDRFLHDRMSEPEALADRAAQEAAAPPIEPVMAKSQAKPEKAAKPEPEPLLLETVYGLAGKLAKAGLMAGIYGVAIATKPLRSVLRRGIGILTPA